MPRADLKQAQPEKWRKIRTETYKLIFKTPLGKQPRKSQRGLMVVDCDKRNWVLWEQDIIQYKSEAAWGVGNSFILQQECEAIIKYKRLFFQ